jgi:very-short-patch-repair endonuclease
MGKFERGVHETNIEKAMRVELERRGYRKGIDFGTQFPIRKSFIIDFVFPTQKIAIECDGEAWHSSPDQLKRDNFKNYILGKKGWAILRFRGQEILDSVEECVNKIEKLLIEG